MAWKLEKTAVGIDIVIGGFDQGIAKSPFDGMTDMRQVNITSMPGVVQAGYPITASTISGATLGIPCSRATAFSAFLSQTGTGGAQAYFILDASGQVFQSSSISGTWTFLSSSNSTSGSSNLDAIIFWKGYLFKFRNDKIDYWNGSTWATAWKTITGGVQHYAISAINDTLYFCNGTTVGSLRETTLGAFDPTSTGTYTFNAATFQLPTYENAQSLAQIGSGTSDSTIQVLVGGSQNVIYPFLTSGTSFQTPIFVADFFIKRMISVNQSVYIFTGNVQGRGRIFITNGTQAEEYFKIPDSIRLNTDPYYRWGDAIFHRGNLVFSFELTTNSAADILLSEVWAIDLNTKAFRSISSINTASGKSNSLVLISDQSNNNSPGFAYITGWYDLSSTSGIGYSGTNAGIGSASITTDQIPVGTFFTKLTCQQVEVKLQTPLQSGESVVVFGIPDNGTFSSAITINTVGAISGYGNLDIQNFQWIQFEAVITGNSQTSGGRLKEIRVHCVPQLP